MKKSLIALAALSAFATAAQAQSSVTVYGTVDMGYTSAQNSRTASGATTTEKVTNTGNGDGALSTSNIGFKGTEDLGGGLKANFLLEYDLKDVGTGANSFGARFSWVGLSDAKLGELRLGRQAQTIHSVVAGGSAGFANNTTGAVYSAGSTDSKSYNYASVRPHNVYVDQAVTYISPNLNGFVFEVQTGEQKTTVTSTADAFTKMSGASLKYNSGKLALAAATYTAENTANNVLLGADQNATKRDTQAFTANYDFGMVQPFAMYTTDKAMRADGTVEREIKVTEVGVRVPVGKTTLFASTYTGDATSANTAAYDNVMGGLADLTMAAADVKGFQVGALYALSKRTTAYAIYGNQEYKGTGSADAGEVVEAKAVSVGIRHAF